MSEFVRRPTIDKDGNISEIELHPTDNRFLKPVGKLIRFHGRTPDFSRLETEAFIKEHIHFKANNGFGSLQVMVSEQFEKNSLNRQTALLKFITENGLWFGTYAKRTMNKDSVDS